MLRPEVNGLGIAFRGSCSVSVTGGQPESLSAVILLSGQRDMMVEGNSYSVGIGGIDGLVPLKPIN